jgi:hypothetical protein
VEPRAKKDPQPGGDGPHGPEVAEGGHERASFLGFSGERRGWSKPHPRGGNEAQQERTHYEGDSPPALLALGGLLISGTHLRLQDLNGLRPGPQFLKGGGDLLQCLLTREFFFLLLLRFLGSALRFLLQEPTLLHPHPG